MTDGHIVVALDVGDRRIGVAVASLEARLPSPLLTIDRTKVGDIFEVIKQLIETQGATALVVGLPRDIEGRETAQTLATRQFADELSKVVSIPIHLQDEAGTSLQAKAELDAKNRPYEKGDVDSLAATFILRDWLNLPPEEAV